MSGGVCGTFGGAYAKFDKIAAELSSSDDGSDDESPPQTGIEFADHASCGMSPQGEGESGAFQRVKTQCMGLLGASDVTSRDAALTGIAREFSTLDRDTAKGLVKFALLPLMLLLRDADKQRPGGVTTGPPMTVHKERAIELALVAMSTVVKTGGVSNDEAVDVLTVSSHMINEPQPAKSEQAAASQGAGKTQSHELRLRASESVVCASVDTIMVLLQDLQRQEADSESAECSLSNAWQDKSIVLGHTVASLLSVAKAGDVLGVGVRQQAIEAVTLIFQVVQGPRERAAFYVPGVVSAMARVLVTSTSKGTRSCLGAAALRCWSSLSRRFLSDDILSGDASEEDCVVGDEEVDKVDEIAEPCAAPAGLEGSSMDARGSLDALRAMAAAPPPIAASSAAAAPPRVDTQRSGDIASARKSSSVGGDGLTVCCDKMWMESVGANYLTLLKRALPVALSHTSLLVRSTMLEMVQVLLLRCATAMKPCIATLLHAAAALCADSNEGLVQQALKLVADWARSGRILEAVSTSSEALDTLLLSLPVTFRCEADQGVKRLAVQNVFGHLRLLQAAGALQPLIDSRLQRLLSALLQCLIMSNGCKQAALQDLHVNNHLAPLRYTAVAVRVGGDGVEQQVATTSSAYRQPVGQLVRERVRDVAAACQRPYQRSEEPPRSLLPPPVPTISAHSAHLEDGALAHDKPPAVTRVPTEMEEEGEGVKQVKSLATSNAYMHKRFEYFTGHELEQLIAKLVLYLAHHHGLYPIIKALFEHAVKCRDETAFTSSLRGPALYLINVTLCTFSSARHTTTKHSVNPCLSREDRTAGGEGVGVEYKEPNIFSSIIGDAPQVEEEVLPELWAEAESGLMGALILNLPPLLPSLSSSHASSIHPPAPQGASTMQGKEKGGMGHRAQKEVVASVDHVMDTYLALCLSTASSSSSTPHEQANNTGKEHVWKCLAIEGVGDFAFALGASFEPKLLRAAFPLLAAAASPNAQVADSAIATLQRVCAACGYASLSELIQRNSDYLIDAICRYLTRGSEPLRRARARTTSRSRRTSALRRVNTSALAGAPDDNGAHNVAVQLQLGVDVLHVLLKHVDAQKASLLADSFEAVLSLLELQPSAQACAALSSTLSAFIAAVADAADAAAPADGGGCGGRGGVGGKQQGGAKGTKAAAGAEEEEEEGLDLGELQLAIECAVEGVCEGGFGGGIRGRGGNGVASGEKASGAKSESVADFFQKYHEAKEQGQTNDALQSLRSAAETNTVPDTDTDTQGVEEEVPMPTTGHDTISKQQAVRARGMIEQVLVTLHTLLSHEDRRVRSKALEAVSAASYALRGKPRLLHPHLHTLWPFLCRRLKDAYPPLRVQAAHTMSTCIQDSPDFLLSRASTTLLTAAADVLGSTTSSTSSPSSIDSSSSTHHLAERAAVLGCLRALTLALPRKPRGATRATVSSTASGISNLCLGILFPPPSSTCRGAGGGVVVSSQCWGSSGASSTYEQRVCLDLLSTLAFTSPLAGDAVWLAVSDKIGCGLTKTPSSHVFPFALHAASSGGGRGGVGGGGDGGKSGTHATRMHAYTHMHTYTVSETQLLGQLPLPLVVGQDSAFFSSSSSSSSITVQGSPKSSSEVMSKKRQAAQAAAAAELHVLVTHLQGNLAPAFFSSA